MIREIPIDQPRKIHVAVGLGYRAITQAEIEYGRRLGRINSDRHGISPTNSMRFSVAMVGAVVMMLVEIASLVLLERMARMSFLKPQSHDRESRMWYMDLLVSSEIVGGVMI